ncbi:Xenotropic and polytropic retrovirus receptor 1 [Coniosporium apollinis]|uniref:Xenotropic and polytropic retrovirus receptor 1 n=1 Tax=Coniosporium apollinis TaxID=61459 RepID=A0ABQ9NNF2_9PEZI|nr:Xenotropic and polytropic retrovirus receptor 1 [Coniosporium apollinis]
MKELEQELVPEWRAKYLDYRQGKKKIKAISRALRNINQTPRTPRRKGPNAFLPTTSDTAPKYSFINRSQFGRGSGSGNVAAAQSLRSVADRSGNVGARGQEGGQSTPSRRVIPIPRSSEEQPLRSEEGQPLTRYGSIIGTPPSADRQNYARAGKPPVLELPDPAMDPEQADSESSMRSRNPLSRKKRTRTDIEANGSVPEAGRGKSHSPFRSKLPSKYRSIFQPRRVNSLPGIEGSRPLMKRMLSLGGGGPPASPRDTDVPLEAYKEVDFRQAEFFNFLDKELDKVEAFYKEKEDEATDRLKVLREQLHIMRDRRLEELIASQTAKMKAKQRKKSDAKGENDGANGGLLPAMDVFSADERPRSNGHIMSNSWLDPLDSALKAAQSGKFGKSTKAMQELGTPTSIQPRNPDNDRDYSRRPASPDVPYRTARRKLKIALQEYYRGLELLKSYALLNQTAFRKINKKYDKAVNAKPSLRYMVEKVAHTDFVRSEVLDGHIRTVEDLYARYFERGNRKVAVGKLKAPNARAGDYTGSTFRNGLFAAAGAVLGIQGVVYGAELLFNADRVLSTQTTFLFQLYGGYFLMLFLVLLFCLVCKLFTVAKINYVFVFEFDTRHHMDWRQLSEIPCFLLFLEGLIVYLNFGRFGGDAMFLYYPIVLIVVTGIILFLPAPILYPRSRSWFAYSNWRLFFSGLYPVEFRDFFLGDMYCSEIYAMGNIPMFFCLYVNKWQNPGQCNSNHSRLMGFFSTLPGIWRALQCLRRYRDTRDVFPHLVNCGKYTMTILYYMCKSLWQIDRGKHHEILFIFFATANAIYCSIWDVVMDFSLGDPYCRYPLLRKTLGYKQVWIYYVALVLDPILRFNWILFAIYKNDIQHTALLSFILAITEVLRRGMWSVLRVENEHCTNVRRFRASRDVPLPYEVSTLTGSPTQPTRDEQQRLRPHTFPPLVRVTTPAHATGVDLEATPGAQANLSQRSRRPESSPSPMTRGMSRIGTLLQEAHAQDFERKRRPEVGLKHQRGFESSDEEDSEKELGGIEDEMGEVNDGREEEEGGDEEANEEREAEAEREIQEESTRGRDEEQVEAAQNLIVDAGHRVTASPERM